jgi:hypothetical protein
MQNMQNNMQTHKVHILHIMHIYAQPTLLIITADGETRLHLKAVCIGCQDSGHG